MMDPPTDGAPREKRKAKQVRKPCSKENGAALMDNQRKDQSQEKEKVQNSP
jgi:hypothetical protein